MNEKQRILSEVSKQHDLWVRIINTFGEYNYADDLVQEMYLLLFKYGQSEKVLTSEGVNFSYIYKTLQNVFLLFKKQQSKIQKVDIDLLKNIPESPSDLEAIEAQTKIYQLIERGIRNLDEYEQHLVTVHIKHKKSFRKIQEATGINKDYLCKEMNVIRQKLQDEYLEDYQDFKNGDYELL